MGEQEYGLIVKHKKTSCLKYDTKHMIHIFNSFGWYNNDVRNKKLISTISLERETEFNLPSILFPEYIFYIVNTFRMIIGFFVLISLAIIALMSIITGIFGEIFTSFETIGILLFILGLIVVAWFLLRLLETAIGRWGENACIKEGLM